ncbi:hypothetical protein QUC31_010658 [Theobroma cacao]
MLLNQSMEELFSASATKLRNESVFSQKRPGETCSHGDEVDWSSIFQQQQMELLPFPNTFWPPSNNQPENILTQASQAPNNSNASLLKRSNSKLSEPDRDRKRKTDKKYREKELKIKSLRCRMMADPLRLENEKLKDENASLRKNANLNNLSLLEAENARLRIENKVLKVQNDAL